MSRSISVGQNPFYHIPHRELCNSIMKGITNLRQSEIMTAQCGTAQWMAPELASMELEVKHQL